MAPDPAQKDQEHPRSRQDRQSVKVLLEGGPSPDNLVELARLWVRYRSFPGARDIQQNLQQLLEQWGLTEDTLYEQTRALHQDGEVYRGRSQDQEDWS